MFCQSCRINFAFYLKYCRQCGERLIDRSVRDADTSQLTSTGAVAEVGNNDSPERYKTAPITMEIGTPGRSLVEIVNCVLQNFPSLNTVRMSDYGSSGGGWASLISRRYTVNTLREFSLTEFKRMESTVELPPERDHKRPAMISDTLELPPEAKRVADTVPLAPPDAANAPPLSAPLTNSRMLSSPPGPARWHVRPTDRQLKIYRPARENRRVDEAGLKKLWNYLGQLLERLVGQFNSYAKQA